jgi:hypothetical protein
LSSLRHQPLHGLEFAFDLHTAGVLAQLGLRWIQESRLISDRLFSQLVRDRRAFGWDSSMSNKEKTLKKIARARKAGIGCP